ncbi:MAG: hypothetical protein WCP99_12010, partial [Burkholderiales bacterium]
TPLRLLVPPGGDLFGRLVSRRSWRNPRRRNSPGRGTPHPARKERGGNGATRKIQVRPMRVHKLPDGVAGTQSAMIAPFAD